MKLFLFTVALLFTLSGCTHYYYISPGKNVPLFKEKNDFKASVATGRGMEIKTVDIQAAYAITNHLAIASNVMIGNGGVKGNTWGKGDYFDFAVGYYKPITKRFVFEVFGGLGTSKQHHEYDHSSTSFSDLAYSSVFIQPSVGLNAGAFDFGLTLGLNRLHFHKVNFHIDNVDSDHLAGLYNISNNRTFYLLEPGYTFRVGWKYIKFQFQACWAYNLSNNALLLEESKGSIGLQFAFANRFMNKKRIP